MPLSRKPRTLESYGWKIDSCNFGEATGICGPRGGLRVPSGSGERFELYDDDENLCAVGRIVGDFDGFEPLDDFGIGYYGCTQIKYRDGWL